MKMDFWEKVKKDIQRGFKDGIYFVKGGVVVVQKTAKKLTKEGQKKLKLYELHSQVQKEMTELGGRIYDLSSKKKNPMLDRKVNTIKKRIEKLEAKIARLEGKLKKVPKKATRKRITKPKSKK
jgi:peptidoglycan hydrolase CwlO-like protein